MLTLGQKKSPMERGHSRATPTFQLHQSIPQGQPTPISNTVSGISAPCRVDFAAFAMQNNCSVPAQAPREHIERQRALANRQDRSATPESVADSLAIPIDHLWSELALDTEQLGNQQFIQLPQTQVTIDPAPPCFDNFYGVSVYPAFETMQTGFLSQRSASDLEQFFPELAEPIQDVHQRQCMSSTEAQLTTPTMSRPQALSDDNLGYHNLRTDALPLGHMQGWLGRAAASGYRDMPRLDTAHLAPPTLSDAHLSPSSASSGGSSASRSPRRSKEDMALGEIGCSQCDAAFSTQSDLTHHLRSHQPYESRNHVCPHCDKRFQYRKDLARHLPKHDPNRRRYYCRFLGCKFHTKGFGRQDHLDRHLASQHCNEPSRRISRSSSNRTVS